MQAPDHVADKALGVHISDPRLGVLLEHGVTDGVHQMRLAQANTPVNKQRVIRFTRVFAHLGGRGLGELVALSLDKGVERERRIEPRLDSHWRGLGRHHRSRARTCRGHAHLPRTHLDDDFGRNALASDDLENSFNVVLL